MSFNVDADQPKWAILVGKPDEKISSDSLTYARFVRKSNAKRMAMTFVIVGLAGLFIYASLFAPTLCSSVARPKLDQTKNLVESIGGMLEFYKTQVGTYPPNLAALVDRAAAGNPPGWAGPYVYPTSSFKDLWDHPLQYRRYMRCGEMLYYLASAGPNGQFGDSDDVAFGTDPNQTR